MFFIPGSNEPATGDMLGDMWLEWLNYMRGQPNVPQTISTPYGINENLLPLEYATMLCNLFAQLCACGVSVIFPSGDFGVGKGTARPTTAPEESSSSPCFLRPVCVAFYFSLRAVHHRRNRPLTTLPRFRRSLGH